MDAKIFRVNYKSDFILTLTSDAGWMTPFCIKFWTGVPSQAYYAQWDGETYTHCAYDPSEPTKLTVQFDDHHLPIGELKYQVVYHFTVDDFPNDTEDEVLNPGTITTEIDGETYQVMLDLTGETAPEIQFSLPAYANEAQRIANEQQRIAAEEARIQNEETRIAAEQTRQQNEETRIAQEEARVTEFARLKRESEAATGAANDAAALANQKAQLAADKAALAQAAATLAGEKAQLADDKAALADAAATLANAKAALAQQKATYAQTQGDYAKEQGDYAKAQGDYAKEQGTIAEEDHVRAEADHTRAEQDHTTAANDHTQGASDHTTAASDHTRAESDHTTAVSDHTRAESDHTTAASDHTRAESDHTTAASDHTRAESDHTRAESDHAAVEVYVDSLGAFDISSYHATGGVLAKYADLSAALDSNNGGGVPQSLQKGGMSVKFVQSSDNKYVQARCMAQNFTTDVTQWQAVDTEIIARSKNIAESNAVKTYVDEDSQLSKQSVLSIQDFALYEGWIDISLKLIDYYNAKYIVIKVNGGDILTKLGGDTDKSFFVILKDFIYNPELPYDFNFATGESDRRYQVRSFALPQDAKYILLNIENSGVRTIPTVLTINNINYLEGLNHRLDSIRQNYSEQDSVGFVATISKSRNVHGHLDSSNTIAEYGDAQHIVLCVNAGDKYFIQPNSLNYCAIAFVKTYNFNAPLPYTLDYATGSTFIDVPSSGENYVVPSDAKFIIVRSKNNSGVDVLPSKFIINGVYNITKTLWNHLEGVIDNNFEGNISITKNYVEYLANENKTVNNVTVTCRDNGDFVINGRCNDNGGRLVKLTSVFTLPAGTYSVKLSGDYIRDNFFYYIESGSSIIASMGGTNDTSFTLSESKNCYIGFGFTVNNEYDYTINIKIENTQIQSVDKTAYDAVARNSLSKIDALSQFTQKNDLKITNIFNVLGYQGMCTINGILCSCAENAIRVKQDGDTFIGTKYKSLGITTHNNDVDYCEYTDTLITAVIQTEDGGVMQLCLLQNAKAKLYSDTALQESDWLRLTMPQELDDNYIIVSNCFGESCDIVYCILIDKVANFGNTNKRLVKIKLGLTDGEYDGTYEILSNVRWSYPIEVQGSKYCNGKLYVSTDDYINTTNLHSSVTVIDVNSLQTIEHVCYQTLNEINDSVEAEGLSFLGEKIYQIVVISPNGEHANRRVDLREFDRFNL